MVANLIAIRQAIDGPGDLRRDADPRLLKNPAPAVVRDYAEEVATAE
jgi:hypothetical protein